MKENANIILTFLDEGISRIKLNDPGNYNALSSKNIKSLINIFKSLNSDNKTKVIIIEGSGKGFSAGHDLKEIRSLKNKLKYKKLFNSCSKLMLEIIEGRKPVIAKVHGAAFAAGCQLVASCDLAISSDDAIFATPGVNIGLFCSTPMVAVSRNINRKQTMEMLLMGDFIDPIKAKEIGLINRIVKEKDLKEETLKVARIIASKSTATVAIGKEAFYKQLEMGIEDAYKYTSKVMSSNMLQQDAQEGISAFIENRDPIWSDN